MRLRDVADDRQPQSGASHRCVAATVEALEDAIALVFRNARAVVLDFEADRIAGHDAHGDAAAAAAMRDGVVDEVGDQLAQQQRVAAHANRRWRRLVGDVDAALPRRRDQLQRRRLRQFAEVDRRQTLVGADVRIGASQQQQLGQQAAQVGDAVADLDQRPAKQVVIVLAQRVLDLRSDLGERRPHLMRRVGDQLLPARLQHLDAAGVVVESGEQRRHLGRHPGEIDRREIGRRPGRDARAQALERAQAADERVPDQHRRGDDEQRLPHQRIGNDALRQRLPRLAGFGDDDRDRSGRERRAVELLVQGHEVDRLAAVLGAVRHRLVAIGHRHRRHRQVVVAGDGLAARRHDAIEDALLHVRFEQLQRRVGQVDVDLALSHVDVFGDRFGRSGEKAVEGAVGNGDGGAIGEPGVEEQQSQQRDQQPEQQLDPQALRPLRGHSRARAG